MGTAALGLSGSCDIPSYIEVGADRYLMSYAPDDGT
jgi:hypothetical protein